MKHWKGWDSMEELNQVVGENGYREGTNINKVTKHMNTQEKGTAKPPKTRHIKDKTETEQGIRKHNKRKREQLRGRLEGQIL